jgi:quercetin dioxygenase-like cupin family protein
MSFKRIRELARSEPVAGYRLRFVHTPGMTMSFWDVEPGAVMPEHTHPHEQISVMIEGEFELTVDGVTRTVREGDVALILSGVPHSGRAVTRCRIYDAFHPPREDFR